MRPVSVVRARRDQNADRPEAAKAMVKALRQLFIFTIEYDLANGNPAKDVPYLKSHSEGFHSWSMEELTKFEDRHPIGSKARLALALLLYLSRRMDMLPPGCEWLFPSPGSATGHVHTIRKAFRRSAERAGLDPDQTTPHTLRHTAVTHLVQSGVDLPTVQRISGHKTLSMVARYAHQSGSHIEAAMDRLEGRVSGVQADNVRKMAPKNSA